MTESPNETHAPAASAGHQAQAGAAESAAQATEASSAEGVTLTIFDELPGVPDGRHFGFATGDIPLPPGGLAYVVEVEPAEEAPAAGAPAASASAPDASTPASADAPAPAAAPASVSDAPAGTPAGPASAPASTSDSDAALPNLRIVGYVDRYSRAFGVDAPLSMPPAQRPDLQFLRYADGEEGAGCVELTREGEDPWRVAEFRATPDNRVTFTDTRVELGDDVRGRSLPLAHALSLAFLAFSYLPRLRGDRLGALSVSEVIRLLRTEELFDAIDHIVAAIDEAASQPLVTPPGVLLYLACMLRGSGAVGMTPADLAPHPDASALPSAAGLSWVAGIASPSPTLPGLFMTLQQTPQAPQVHLVRTAEYADLFYVAFDRDQVSDEGARVLFEVEGVLNRFLLMVQRLDEVGALATATPGQCAELDRWIVEDVLAQGTGLLREAGLLGGGEGVPTSPGAAPDDAALASALDDVAEPLRALLDQMPLVSLLGATLPAVGAALGEGEDGSGAKEVAPASALAASVPGVGASGTAGPGLDLDGQIEVDYDPEDLPHFFAAEGPTPAPERGDLDVRLAFARVCESLKLPYRLEYRFRYDAGQGGLDVDVSYHPAPEVMPRERWVRGADGTSGSWAALSPAERAGDAARYTLHQALLVACAAFACDERVRHVSVNVWGEQPSEAPADAAPGAPDAADASPVAGSGAPAAPAPQGDPCMLSVAFDRAAFLEAFADAAALPTDASDLASAPASAQPAGASASADAPAPAAPHRSLAEADPFAFVRRFRHAYAFKLGEGQGLLPVAPLPQAAGSWEDALEALRSRDVETDDSPLPERAVRLLRARRVRDLGIYEDAPRRTLAQQVMRALRFEDTSDVLATIRDLYSGTESVPVREACLRASEGVASGALTEESEGAVKELFSDVYGLQAGLKAASRQAARDPMGAVASLESLALQVEERGWFADTDTRVYRYFDCYASRVLYETHCARTVDGGRELRLCADEHFLIHHRLASLLSDSIEHVEEAIAHAQRCVEIAPSVAAAHLRLARCYFSAFDYESEIDVLRRMLTIAWNPTDVGMALYWLGYAFWMTGRPRLGLACYQRCVVYDRSLAEPCTSEVSEFLRKEGMRPQLIPDDEVRELFREGGVRLGQVEMNAHALMRAAGFAADAGSYRLAQNLLGSASTILRDDALAPVLESFGPTS